MATACIELDRRGHGRRCRTAPLAGPGPVDVIHEGRTVRGRTDRGAAVIPAALAALEQGGVQVASATVPGPPSTTSTCAMPAARSRWRHETTLALHSALLTRRSVTALVRQPAFVAITLVQPAIWLLLFGALFETAVQIPGFGADGRSYLEYLTPGVVAMTALFSAAWAGTVYIEDMTLGVMDRMLASPVRRGAMMSGTLAYQSITAIVQTPSSSASRMPPGPGSPAPSLASCSPSPPRSCSPSSSRRCPTR